MPNFIITYHSEPVEMSPEEGQAHRAEYQKWIMNLGDAAVSPMNPLKAVKTITRDGETDGGGDGFMMGYTIIKADDMDAAMEITRSCPFLVMGSLRVAEIMQMS